MNSLNNSPIQLLIDALPDSVHLSFNLETLQNQRVNSKYQSGVWRLLQPNP